MDGGLERPACLCGTQHRQGRVGGDIERIESYTLQKWPA
jgi:hypothetical protein